MSKLLETATVQFYLNPSNPVNVEAALLGWSLHILLKEHPALLDDLVPGFLFRRTSIKDEFVVLDGRPPENWGDSSVAAAIASKFRLTPGQMRDTLLENYHNIIEKKAIFYNLAGEEDILDNYPMLIRRLDFSWCRVRLGWSQTSVPRRMLEAYRSRDLRANYSTVIQSVDFRLLTFSRFGAPLYKCAACGHCSPGDKLRRCSQCGRVAYCDQDCQKRHWPYHKPRCNCVDPSTIDKESMLRFIQDV